MFEEHYDQAVCVGCGGPVRGNHGQRVSMTADWQIMPDGTWVSARQNTGRCGACNELLDDLEQNLAAQRDLEAYVQARVDGNYAEADRLLALNHQGSCVRCNGTKVVGAQGPHPPLQCPRCDGTGIEPAPKETT